MIELEDVLTIHRLLIDEYGGTGEVRDLGLLKAALERPYQTFDQQELYSTPVKKAAAILESIVMNHPFLDGNKRVGYVLMRLFLLDGGLDIDAKTEEKVDLVLQVAKGEFSVEEIEVWITERIVKK